VPVIVGNQEQEVRGHGPGPGKREDGSA